MANEFSASKPIYRQIAEQLFKKMIRGEIKPGEKLPSVRELAVQTQVNPNTIQRTYNEMERMGVVETRRGQGTFVVEHTEVIDDLKREMRTEVIGQFVQSMEELGLSKQDMLLELDRFLQKGDPK
ncbi:GntR family transcriptional regulator [Bacillus paralicheniformis]|uniref:Transcriptional regulator GntR family n=1 Tax=Bacillus paralicheniformis TaxID=1648923 RepID=A0A7Z1B2D1_9BACI|nr:MULTISPECIES: GntR family transcriptional regulator [Bacillus]MBC8624098.1 GntR family transcriptional regulator [Robertmurraya crescens]POO83609.1 GntR family transcriptional regulator [Bacillus sp. MBGLi97]KAA0839788.1 GntR family transcriptional regulator [Bacillus paralicheniformis]KAA0840913.1 GntR family transcriptional regulator [Bacillus paralicheniformis]MBW4885406.1 GntR family transcriptional regulator [Bacillus sp. (in: firmicutes)]